MMSLDHIYSIRPLVTYRKADQNSKERGRLAHGHTARLHTTEVLLSDLSSG